MPLSPNDKHFLRQHTMVVKALEEDCHAERERQTRLWGKLVARGITYAEIARYAQVDEATIRMRLKRAAPTR